MNNHTALARVFSCKKPGVQAISGDVASLLLGGKTLLSVEEALLEGNIKKGEVTLLCHVLT